jgi:Arc/MetJ family transcription regulator
MLVYGLTGNYTQNDHMRTNIDIDDALMAKALRASRLPTKRATVEEALRLYVERSERLQALEDLAGIGWDGDLDAMREGRGPAQLP